MRVCRQIAWTLLLAAVLPDPAFGGLTDMLMVVGNPAALTAQETSRQTGFQNAGYTVTLIDDGASQASYNAALVGKNVAYVPITVNAAAVGTKLKNTTIGVVNEAPALADEFGFSNASYTTSSRNYLRIQSTSNFITYGHTVGANLTILTANYNLARRTGTIAAGAVNLASVEAAAGVYDEGILMLDVGAALFGGGTTAGRRLLLPVGDTSFNIGALNSAGQSLFLKSVEWAACPNPTIGDLLFVVTSTASPTSQEWYRRYQINVWGYNTTLIDDAASQASFNTALAASDVVYVSEEIDTASLGTKITNATIGVVNEEFELTDELKLATSRTFTTGTAINITNNTHYITAEFATGSLTLFTASHSVGYLSGTLASGQQTLAKWGTERGLVVLEVGAALQGSGNAAGRRVQLPWAGGTFDFTDLTTSGKKMMRWAIEWAAEPAGARLLLVVADPDTLTTQESDRIALFESWGYSTIVIDDDAPLASYTAAIPGCSVVYVSEETTSTSIGTKLTNSSIGIVNEEQAFTNELGISSSATLSSATQLQISSNTHYITSVFPLGALTIFSTAQETVSVAGTVASDGKSLATWGANKTLVAVESGGKLSDGTFAAGRRVQLPWGGGSFDINALTTNGETLLKRAIEWAHGLRGHWKLDETTGTIASDSSG